MRGRPGILYIFYTTVAFLLFFLLTFPYDLAVRNLLRQFEQSLPVTLEYGGGEWGWLKGYRLHDATISLFPSRAGEFPSPLLRFSHIAVRPAWGSLLTGHLFPARFSAGLFGGTANGEIVLADSVWRAACRWRDLDISRYALPPLWNEGQILGFLSGTLSLEEGKAFPVGEILFFWEKGGVQGKIHGIPLPEIRSIQASVRATLRDGRVQFTEAKVESEQGEGELTGQLLLRRPLPQSIINLRLTLRVNDAASPLQALFALLPTPPSPDGHHTVMLYGTLARPRLR